MARFDDLQVILDDIASALAAKGADAVDSDEAHFYRQLHSDLVQVAQTLAVETDRSQLLPQDVAAVLDHAAQVVDLLRQRMPPNALSPGIDRLVATISALPGKPTTGGGGPIGG